MTEEQGTVLLDSIAQLVNLGGSINHELQLIYGVLYALGRIAILQAGISTVSVFVVIGMYKGRRF